MKNRLKKIYFKFKDQTSRSKKDKQNKIQAENAYSNPASDAILITDRDETDSELTGKSEQTELDYFRQRIFYCNKVTKHMLDFDDDFIL